MAESFAGIHNCLESLVLQSVRYHAARYPTFAEDEELLADVACVALNHLLARNILDSIDSNVYRTSENRGKDNQTIDVAVISAFDCIFARGASSSRPLLRDLHTI
jgi:hypothetical protein